jgi:hypothetical protein
MSIMSEILLIKNNGKLKHMKWWFYILKPYSFIESIQRKSIVGMLT